MHCLTRAVTKGHSERKSEGPASASLGSEGVTANVGASNRLGEHRCAKDVATSKQTRERTSSSRSELMDVMMKATKLWRPPHSEGTMQPVTTNSLTAKPHDCDSDGQETPPVRTSHRTARAAARTGRAGEEDGIQVTEDATPNVGASAVATLANETAKRHMAHFSTRVIA